MRGRRLNDVASSKGFFSCCTLAKEPIFGYPLALSESTQIHS